MTLALIVWLVMTVLPGLTWLGGFLGALIVVCLFVGSCVACDYGIDNIVFRNLRKHVKWMIPVMLLALFTPNKETAWYMVGAYATQTVVQSDTAKELASDSVDVLKSLIKKSKEYIDADQAKELDKAAQASPKLKQERT